MLKRFDARLLTMGALVPMMMAGCSTTAPTSAPDTPQAQPAPATQVALTAQASAAKYSIQGGQDLGGAYMNYAANPCGECPAAVPALAAGILVSPFALWTFDYLSSHPLLDYSWYYARGNFAVFGWANDYYAHLADFMWYPTAAGYWPYAYNAGVAAYTPYVGYAGGAPIYPYLGYGLDPYVGLEVGAGLAAPVMSLGTIPVPAVGGYGGYDGKKGDVGAYSGGKGDVGAYSGGKGAPAQTYSAPKKDRGGNGGQAYSRNGGQAMQQGQRSGY